MLTVTLPESSFCRPIWTPTALPSFRSTPRPARCRRRRESSRCCSHTALFFARLDSCSRSNRKFYAQYHRPGGAICREHRDDGLEFRDEARWPARKYSQKLVALCLADRSQGRRTQVIRLRLGGDRVAV